MPTPFTHLEVAQRLLADEVLPDTVRNLLNAERGTFLLGNVAADARVDSGIAREHTHFYAYTEAITTPPWRVMLDAYPALRRVRDGAHRAFLAGYVAHLSMDAVWTQEMLEPYFVRREWGSRVHRFVMLHILLIYMDERDRARLGSWQHLSLRDAQPNGWLPFMSDEALRAWRDFIVEQIEPGGASQTLALLGERVGRTPEELRAILDSPETMEAELWAHVPQDALARVEAKMYTHAREQVAVYVREFGA